MIEYRIIKFDELNRKLFGSFIRHQVVTKCYRKEDTIHVIIENDCQVLSQDTLNHIFDKFYQGDPSHAAKGNGLGLPLVKRIIQLCGGYITVISDSKHGISFDIELPCADSENGDQK